MRTRGALDDCVFAPIQSSGHEEAFDMGFQVLKGPGHVVDRAVWMQAARIL